jgi:hypothetical protein
MNFIFPYIGNVIIPTDELIFFRGVGQPPTRYMQHDSIMVVSFRVWFQRWSIFTLRSFVQRLTKELLSSNVHSWLGIPLAEWKFVHGKIMENKTLSRNG